MQNKLMASLLAGSMAAWLCYAAPSRAEGVSVDEATPEQAEAAQEAFLSADKRFDVQEYDEALEHYRASYDIVASPNTRLMIARSLRELGRLDEAYPEYEAATAEAEQVAAKNAQYEPTLMAAREELQALRTRVGLLTVDLGDVSTDSEITVAGKPVDAAALDRPVVVMPGRVVVVATAPDGRKASAEVQVAAGRDSSIRLQLGLLDASPETPDESGPVAAETEQTTALGDGSEPSSSSLKTWAYVAGGVGVAGLATYGVFGVLNNRIYSDLESDCPNGDCPARRESDIDKGRKYQIVSFVGLGVGVVGIGVGATLFYLGHGKENATQAAVYVGPGSLNLRGRF